MAAVTISGAAARLIVDADVHEEIDGALVNVARYVAAGTWKRHGRGYRVTFEAPPAVLVALAEYLDSVADAVGSVTATERDGGREHVTSAAAAAAIRAALAARSRQVRRAEAIAAGGAEYEAPRVHGDAAVQLAHGGAALRLTDGRSASTEAEAETRAEAYARGMLDARRIGLPAGMREADGMAVVRGYAADRRASDTRRAYWYGAARGNREDRGRRAAEAVGRFFRGGALAAAARLVARYGYSVAREAATSEDGPTYSVRRATADGGAVAVDVGWMDAPSALAAALYRAEAAAVADADADALRELETWRRMIAPETEHEADGADGPPDALALAAALDAARAIVLGAEADALRHAAEAARYALAGMDAEAYRAAEPMPTVLPPQYRAAAVAALALAAGDYARPDEPGGPLRALDAIGGTYGATIRNGLAAREAEREAESRAIGEARLSLRAALRELDAGNVDAAARHAYRAAQYAETEADA
jgi:hypothetical protein